MQLRIECSSSDASQQQCMLCHQMYELKQAKVSICSSNHEYGAVCPDCIHKGFQWMQVKLLESQTAHAVHSGHNLAADLRKSA